MEALAAFGLACNVMQTISFTIQTASVCKDVFSQGSAHPDTEALARRSTEVYKCLRGSLPLGVLGEDEQRLVDIANDCLKAGDELQIEIAKTSFPSAKGRPLVAVFRGIQAKVRASRAESLKRRMLEHQRVLESGLLIRVCSQHDALCLQQERSFGDLDSTLRGFIQAYAHGQRHLEGLLNKQADSIKRVIRAETHRSQQAVVAHVSSESQKTRADLVTLWRETGDDPPMWQKRQRLRRSLKYDGMNERFNQIAESHDGTYRWILEGIRPWLDETEAGPAEGKDGAHLHPDCSQAIEFPNVVWKCFPCWLGSATEKMYWVQGKVGSGKSTLMKFLVLECDEIIPHGLNSSKDRVVLSHFLWAAGSPLQRSIRGILLSLIQQFLSKQDQILDALIDTFPGAVLKDTHDDWKREELESIARTWFAKSEKPVIIFLDGLDEMGDLDSNMVDTPANLLRLLNRLASIDKVQLCVSSRLKPEFQAQLQKMPTLRLQDVTLRDMKVYAECYLLQPSFGPSFDEAYRELIETLCDKADGVFLWLALAVRSLSRGLANGDEIVELKLRVDRMPGGLYSLYQDMWSRMNEDQGLYREEAARYFNMVRDWSQFAMGYSLIEVFHIMMASDPDKSTSILEDYDALSSEKIEADCRTISKRIATRTAGLLEIGADGRLVGFIHRSAVEFLENTPEGRKILSYDQTPPKMRILNLVRAFLAGVCLQVTGRRKTMPYSPIAEYWVTNAVYRLWVSGHISDEDGFALMMSCKRLYEAGKWRTGAVGSDPARRIHMALDFSGMVASFGFVEVVSQMAAGGDISRLLPHEKRYLLGSCCIDPNVSHDVDCGGKALLMSELLGQDRLCDLEDSDSRLPVMFFAVLNAYAGSKHWPTTPGVPPLPDLLDQYLGSLFSLDEKITFSFQRRPADDDDIWLPNIHCTGVIETMYARQSSTWVTLEADLASFAGLCLQALVAGSDSASAHELSEAQRSLLVLKALRPAWCIKVVAFGFPITNMVSRSIVGDRDGKPLAPVTVTDAELVLSSLNKLQLRPHEQTEEEGSPDREYYVPGLWKCLRDIATSAQALEEEDLEKAKDLPLSRALVELMTNSPKPFVN